MSTNTVLVDVRDDIRNGREPFSKVMNAAAALHAGQQLLLIAPFEPVPLVNVLAKQGFRHTAQAKSTGEWEVRFDRAPSTEPFKPAAARPICGAESLGCAASDVLEVDARGLEPPMPLVKIFESLASLPAGATLNAHTDRRPIHLYAQLEERGFSAQTEEQPDGSFITHIVAS
jgi:uncharacterized protein (DUF2249 family)